MDTIYFTENSSKIMQNFTKKGGGRGEGGLAAVDSAIYMCIYMFVLFRLLVDLYLLSIIAVEKGVETFSKTFDRQKVYY